MVLHRVGARRWIARIMISWRLISAAMALSDSASTFYVLRFLLGAAEAGFIPGILLHLTYWFPAHRRGRISALFLTGIPLATVIGGPLSGGILSGLAGVGGLAGWQWLLRGNIAGAIGPSLTGIMSEATGSTASSLYLVGGLLALGILLVLLLRRDQVDDRDIPAATARPGR